MTTAACTFAAAALATLSLMALARVLVDRMWTDDRHDDRGTWHPFED